MRAKPAIDRLLPRVVPGPGGCWIFTGATRNGYGVVGLPGKHIGYCHRVTYEHFVDLIPEGLDLDHLCRERRCCRPDHLEPVTRGENLRRGFAARGPRTHCYRGHEYTPETTIHTGQQTRHCRICHEARQLEKEAA